MITTDSMIEAVYNAWSNVPPSPIDDLKCIGWSCGEESLNEFVGVPPVKVDRSSSGFLSCTPLLELPDTACAAYLGSYLLSFLEGLRFQEKNGIFYDILTRAHVLHCLSQPCFWENIIRLHVSHDAQKILSELCSYLASRRELLALSENQTNLIENLSKEKLFFDC